MGTSSIRIRWSLDEAAIAKLQAECLPGDKPTPLSPLEHDWWVAYRGKEPVGFVCLAFGPGYAYLKLVAVAESARGQGLQRRLMAVALRYAKKQGRDLAISYTAAWNHASSNNFIASGWRLYTPEYKWGWADGLYWRKTL